MCCSVLQCVAVFCSELLFVADLSSFCGKGSLYEMSPLVLQCVAVCCSVLHCAAVCCSMLQCVAVCSVRVGKGSRYYASEVLPLAHKPISMSHACFASPCALLRAPASVLVG